MQTNIIHAAHKVGVEKLLFLGSSCTYPKNAPQPLKEETLLHGHPEPTNVWYAVAKLAGIKMCQAYRKQYGCDFIVGMPANSYGVGDNCDPQQSHVVPALMRRLHEAKKNDIPTIEIWGSGTPQREFIYVSDVADACVFLIKNYSAPEIVNIGSANEISIGDLAQQLANTIGFKGGFSFDSSKPDGMMRKALDSKKLFDLGWRPTVPLDEGLKRTYTWFQKTYG
jgi:GDP-L-fucose synthase